MPCVPYVIRHLLPDFPRDLWMCRRSSCCIWRSSLATVASRRRAEAFASRADRTVGTEAWIKIVVLQLFSCNWQYTTSHMKNLQGATPLDFQIAPAHGNGTLAAKKSLYVPFSWVAKQECPLPIGSAGLGAERPRDEGMEQGLLKRSLP